MLTYYYMPPKPNNYLVWAILVTLFCCLPFGIVAIVKACAVDSAYAANNLPEAEKASAEAKKWCIWSALTGVIISVLYFIMMVLGAALSS